MLPYFDAEMVREISRLERELGALKAWRRAELGVLPSASATTWLKSALAALRRWLTKEPALAGQSTHRAEYAHRALEPQHHSPTRQSANVPRQHVARPVRASRTRS